MSYHPTLKKQLLHITNALHQGELFSLDEMLYQISKTYSEYDEQYTKIKQELIQLKKIPTNNELLLQSQTIAELQENEKKYRSLYQISSDAVLIIENEQIIDCNYSALKMFGYESVETFKTIPLEELWPRVESNQHHKSNKYTQDIKKTSLDEESPYLQHGQRSKRDDGYPSQPLYHFEWMQKRLNGELFPAEVILYSFEIDTRFFIQAVIRDITLQKKIEEKLIQAKEAAELENKAKTDFLANMSHEIRTPTNAIIGFCDLLGVTSLNDQQTVMLQHLKDSAKLLLTIINDILVFSSLEEGAISLKNTPLDMEKFVKSIGQIVTPLVKSKKLHLNIPSLSPSYTLLVDPDRLKQVLINLLSNAIKFTERGKIDLNILYLKETDTHVKMRVEVVDTGVGISQNIQKKLFHRFQQGDNSFTKKHQGTGLGLAICKHLIELMNGTIGVLSEEGKGSTFWFEIELEKSQESLHQPASALPQIPDFKGRKILLVEDNQLNQMVALGVLEPSHVHVTTAINGKDALEKLEQEAFDLILMDIHMPILDGFAATKMIRTLEDPHKSNIPIIALTANVMPHELALCTESGMNDYISKPIMIEQFYHILQKYIFNSNHSS